MTRAELRQAVADIKKKNNEVYKMVEALQVRFDAQESRNRPAKKLTEFQREFLNNFVVMRYFLGQVDYLCFRFACRENEEWQGAQFVEEVLALEDDSLFD